MPYTIVQHSAVATSHAEFLHGLEPASVTDKQAADVTQAGGLIFGDYTMADDYCDREQYPDPDEGLIPRAPGTFGSLKIQGRPIYIPKPQRTWALTLDEIRAVAGKGAAYCRQNFGNLTPDSEVYGKTRDGVFRTETDFVYFISAVRDSA